MTVWFVIATLYKRNDVADIAWGVGFLGVAILSLYQRGIAMDRGLLVTILVAIWAVRLSVHIFLRNRNKSEDYRYKQWRREWGRWFYLRSFVQVFLLQGLLLLFIVSPVVIAVTFRGGPLGFLDVVGVIVWGIGFFFETVGDWQLSRFTENPENKGKILTSGLWQYTRHPNYFGEVALWWGMFIIALSVPFGWMGIIGPIIITLLLLFVSGVPLLERKKLGNVEYERYKRRTSMFFPLPPRTNLV